MRILWCILIVAATAATNAAPLDKTQCSEQCVQYLLHDTTGPKLLRLLKELMKRDSKAPKSPVKLNGSTFDVTAREASLINNSLRRGVSEEMLEHILEEADIFPSGTTSITPSHKPIQQESTSTSRISPEREPITERRPSFESTIRPQKYKIHTSPTGEINLDVGGESLKIPQDISRLPSVVHDTTTLSEIVTSLKGLGVPINLQHNRVTYIPKSSSTSTPYRLRVKIQKLDGQVDKVEVDINDRKFNLPGDESSLSKFLENEPEVSFQLLQILANHKVPVEYDSILKTIKLNKSSTSSTATSSISGRTPIPQRSSSSQKIYTIHIGSRTYTIPDDWDRLNQDMQDRLVSASAVQELLQRQNITIPGYIMTTIRSVPTTTIRTNMQVIRKGDGSVSIELDGKRYDLPTDNNALSTALSGAGFPIDRIRDTLLRVGVDTRKIGSTLRIILPTGDTYLNNLPTTRIYDYKVVTRSGGATITTSDDEFNLPADNSRLERAIADRKVLAQNVIDSFNSVGIPASMDFSKQEMKIDLSSGTIRIPVNIQGGSGGSGGSGGGQTVTLRMKARGTPGNMVYTIVAGEEEIELPSSVFTLNNRIRLGKIDADLLMRLFDKMNISHRYDSLRGYHMVTMNDKTIEIAPTPTISQRKY